MTRIDRAVVTKTFYWVETTSHAMCTTLLHFVAVPVSLTTRSSGSLRNMYIHYRWLTCFDRELSDPHMSRLPYEQSEIYSPSHVPRHRCTVCIYLGYQFLLSSEDLKFCTRQSLESRGKCEKASPNLLLQVTQPPTPATRRTYPHKANQSHVTCLTRIVVLWIVVIPSEGYPCSTPKYERYKACTVRTLVQ